MINLDKFSIEIPCPKCIFYNPIFLRQARLQDVIICRGCKRNIQLNDQMAECQREIRRVEKALDEFEETLKRFSNIEIKINL